MSQFRSVRLALTAREACTDSSACACPIEATRRSKDNAVVAGVGTLTFLFGHHGGAQYQPMLYHSLFVLTLRHFLTVLRRVLTDRAHYYEELY